MLVAVQPEDFAVGVTWIQEIFLREKFKSDELEDLWNGG